MKKFIYSVAALLVGMTFTSCEDFLDKTPFDRVDPQTNVTDEVAVALATYLSDHPTYITRESGVSTLWQATPT